MDTFEKIFDIILNTEKTLVFTSETMARNTLSVFLKGNKGKAVFTERFQSWDTFLLSLSDTRGKRAVTETERRVFVSSFLRKEGEGKLSHFASNDYSESLPAFTKYISSLLPYFPSSSDPERSNIPPSILQEMDLIRGGYEEYLSSHSLYEKNYLSRDLEKIEKGKYVFVFPSSFTSTFASVILKSGKVEEIEIPECSNPLPLHSYRNSISEIRGVMRMIEKDLLSEDPDDIAITSSSLDTYRPYMEEEAKKRDIPLIFTSFSPLSSYPEGKILEAMYEAVKTNWSLEEVKNLILDPSFPFKDRNLLVAIIRIGVDMKMEGGGYRKWMKAFDTAINNEKKYKCAKEAKDLFSSIYIAVEMIVKAKNSLDAERRIREFRDTFLLEGVWDEKSDRILGSILEILEEMKEMEDSNTFRVFLSILRDTSYVEKAEGIKGVRVYSYPASAGLSVKKHYIMGLDDKSTSMVLDDYPFLPKDGKRETVDLGSALLSLYSNPSFSSFTYISGTTTAYDGSRLLPVPFLSSTIEVTEVERDSYSEEREKERKLKPTLSESLSYEVAEHTVMKRRGIKTEVDPLLDSPLEFSVSEIKSWDICPYKGYAQSILKIRKSEWECEMEDHFEKGNILHETIQKALEEKKSFAAFDEDTLLRHLENALEKSMNQNRIPDEGVRLHIKKDIEKHIASFSSSFGHDFFSQGILVKNEMSITGHALGENAFVRGRLDTVLKDRDGKWYILDYKLRGTNDYNPTLIEENSLQLILYYRLLTDEKSIWDKEVEKETGIEVEYGGFYSLMDESFKVLWPEVKKTRSVNGFSLDIVKLDAEKRIKSILNHMKNGMITPDSSEDNCKNCEYKRLCRGRFVAR